MQPFYPEIPRVGERSLLSFGGVFSHTLLKVPSRGDLRAPTTFSGDGGGRGASAGAPR
ncbi:hypothetical protein SCE1572_02385 [Sorangium cellulosum So0157-2]|uniref:Uncharacterized protein n=1 Tax=Sorangium cellulosum So0157-2 TaxID=1254432 RepID=S4XNX6_SORCE|nr:hypothetical protein SCE1572_02385 [Sorangium cellulosum So0157-2]